VAVRPDEVEREQAIERPTRAPTSNRESVHEEIELDAWFRNEANEEERVLRSQVHHEIL
jgi:hypothetical protein